MWKADPPLGWATDRLVSLDRLAPGVLARALTASPLRRQAIYAAVATRQIMYGDLAADHEVPDDVSGLAERLLRERGREIIRYAFGGVPNGLAGALEKIGAAPLARPEGYIALHAIFAQPSSKNVADALRYVDAIDDKMLAAVEVLDGHLVHQNVLTRLNGAVDAKDFNRAMAVAQTVCSRATNEAVANSIAHMSASATLPGLVYRWLLRADCVLPHPIADDDELRALRTVSDITEAGRRYQNCLADKVEDVLAGRVAFAEYGREAILEFRPMAHGVGWLFWAAHGPYNNIVSGRTQRAVQAKMDQIGQPRLAADCGNDDWRRYRRFTRLQDAAF